MALKKADCCLILLFFPTKKLCFNIQKAPMVIQNKNLKQALNIRKSLHVVSPAPCFIVSIRTKAAHPEAVSV
jgi:hypothetical protein